MFFKIITSDRNQKIIKISIKNFSSMNNLFDSFSVNNYPNQIDTTNLNENSPRILPSSKRIQKAPRTPQKSKASKDQALFIEVLDEDSPSNTEKKYDIFSSQEKEKLVNMIKNEVINQFSLTEQDNWKKVIVNLKPKVYKNILLKIIPHIVS